MSGLSSPWTHPAQNTVPPHAAHLLMVMYCLLEVSQQVVCVAEITTCPPLSSSFIQLSHQFQVLPEIMQKNKMICWHNFFPRTHNTFCVLLTFHTVTIWHTQTHIVHSLIIFYSLLKTGPHIFRKFSWILLPNSSYVLPFGMIHITEIVKCSTLTELQTEQNPSSRCSLHNTPINSGQPITVLRSDSTIRHKQQNHMHLIFKFSWDFQVSLTTYHGFVKLPHHFKCVAEVTTWLGLSQFVTHRSATKTRHFIVSLAKFILKIHIAEIHLSWLPCHFF